MQGFNIEIFLLEHSSNPPFSTLSTEIKGAKKPQTCHYKFQVTFHLTLHLVIWIKLLEFSYL